HLHDSLQWLWLRALRSAGPARALFRRDRRLVLRARFQSLLVIDISIWARRMGLAVSHLLQDPPPQPSRNEGGRASMMRGQLAREISGHSSAPNATPTLARVGSSIWLRSAGPGTVLTSAWMAP